MITALHTLVYSTDPAATRRFFRDVLRWPSVSDAASSGPDAAVDPRDPTNWLIFATGRGELGVHPTMDRAGADVPHHEISLMCDDLGATMAELAERGAEFRGPPDERGYGLAVDVAVPGSCDVQLYQPHHSTAYDLDA